MHVQLYHIPYLKHSGTISPTSHIAMPHPLPPLTPTHPYFTHWGCTMFITSYSNAPHPQYLIYSYAISHTPPILTSRTEAAPCSVPHTVMHHIPYLILSCITSFTHTHTNPLPQTHVAPYISFTSYTAGSIPLPHTQLQKTSGITKIEHMRFQLIVWCPYEDSWLTRMSCCFPNQKCYTHTSSELIFDK